MKHLLNTLYILSEDIYLALDGENITANRTGQVAARYPLHTLQNIIRPLAKIRRSGKIGA